jgi:hypothetical protein
MSADYLKSYTISVDLRMISYLIGLYRGIGLIDLDLVVKKKNKVSVILEERCDDSYVDYKNSTLPDSLRN